MGWEQRGNRRYYYRKKRVGPQVFSQYIGPDEVGREAELDDTRERLYRRQAKGEQAAAIEQINQLRGMDQLAHQAENRTRSIIKAAYLINGYHTHHRQWRRWRKK